MIGIPVLLVIAAVVAGVFIWHRQRGRAAGAEDWRRAGDEAFPEAAEKPARVAGRSPSPGPGTLGNDLSRWVGAGLISSEQADAIAGFERATAAGRGPVGGERRVSLLAEALGYAGAVLALAGAGVGLGQTWEDLAVWARLLIPSVATLLLVLAGAVLRRQTEPAFRRLMSVLWMLSVGSGAWALAVLGVDVLEVDGEYVALIAGAGCTGLAGILWLVRRVGLQQAAMLASLHVLVVSGVVCLLGEDPPLWVPAVAVWALGAAWAALGWRSLIEPGWLAVALGCLGAVVGPAIGLGDYTWLLAPALLTTAGLMAVSVPTRQTPLLALGTMGAFGYIFWAVVHFFEDSLGMPVALVIIGVVFLLLAVLAGSLLTRGKHKPVTPTV